MHRPRTLAVLLFALLAALAPVAASANTCDCYEGNQEFVRPTKFLGVGPGVTVEVSGTSAPYLLSAYRTVDHVGIHNVVVPSNNFTVRSDYNGYLYAVIYDNGGVTTLLFFSGGSQPVYQVSGSVFLEAIGPEPIPMSGISYYFAYSQSFGDDKFIHFVDGGGNEVYGLSGYRLGFDGFGANGRLALVTGPSGTDQQIQLLNLEAQSAELIQTLSTSTEFWFSICSDEFGWVTSDNTNHLFDVEMHGTKDAGVSGSTSVSMSDVTGLTLAADTASFIARGVDTNSLIHTYVLASNAPAPPCPPAPSPIAVSAPQSEVPGGITLQGTVTLDSPAPAGGMSVGMMSDNNNVASADNATIAAGATQGPFTITTHSVSFPQTVHITPFTTTAVQLTLTVDSAPPQLQGIYVFPGTVPAGTTAEVDFVLSSPALGSGAVISLSSSDTTVLRVPPTVTVPFSIPSTYLFVTPPYSATDHSVILTASYLGVTLQKTIQVQGPRPASLKSVDRCIVSGQPIHARVELTIPSPPGGLDVAVVNSDTTQPRLPLIHIPHDRTAMEFDVPTTTVGSPETITITAVANGAGTTLDADLQPPQSFWVNYVEPYDHHEYYPVNDAFGMNNYGEVVGDVDNGSGYSPSLAYAWLPGTLRIVPDLPGMSPPAVAYAISDQRVVVGEEGGHAFRYDGTLTLDLTPDGGVARAVSSHGGVAGAMNVLGTTHAFYHDSTLHDLGTLGGTSSEADGINSSDVVVGWADIASGQAHAFEWSAAGGMQDLGLPPGMTQAYALAINREGVVVGYATDGTLQPHACKWEGGTAQLLDVFVGQAVAINDGGQIAGRSNNHPVMWDGAARTALDQLPGVCGWDNTVAPSAINNRAQIAGTGQSESGPYATVLSLAQGPTTAVQPGPAAPPTFGLTVIGANPVRGALSLRCSLTRSGPARLDLVDIAGRRIASRALRGEAGVQQIAIPETEAISPGVYFARLAQGAGARVARVVIVR